MDLEGTLIVERRPLRRWVSAIAVIVPVVAFVGATAWFVRAFVAPPMIAIPSPMMLASAPPAPAPKAPPKAQPQVAASEQPKPATATEPTAKPNTEAPPPAAEKPVVTAASAPAVAPATGLPMFTSLAVAPPALTSGSTHSAFADPTADRQTTMMPADAAAPPADPQAADPITGAVPIPRSEPEVAVALVTATVPLPRSRPAEAAPEPAPEIVQFNRHFVE